jgi:hypothetical protein
MDKTGGESSLVAKLGAGESFEIANIVGWLLNALIQVETINIITNPPVAQVSVNLKCTSNSDCDDGDMCTTNTCNISAGICIHAPNVRCLMRTELLTDKYPEETSWNIVDKCDNDTKVISGSGYTTKFGTYADTVILPPSQYTLEIKDVYGDGVCCGQENGVLKCFTTKLSFIRVESLEVVKPILGDPALPRYSHRSRRCCPQRLLPKHQPCRLLNHLPSP